MKALREDRIGRYELLIELGRGGMAELFLGRLHGAGGFAKLVAIKRILPHLAQDKQFKEMFLNEGRIAANLSHPNVCQVFELDEVDDELFLAMEYLDGVSWDLLSRELATGNFAMRLAVGVIAQACEGLHYAHMLRDVEGNPISVVHRDVSPHNLFVTVDGVCKVLDFGVSKVMTDGPRTKSGVIKGKLPYMAPEQIRGEATDARADVFALGVCAWEALTTKRLFDRPTDFMIWKAITEEDVPSMAMHWPECPPAVDAVVRRALDRDPNRRYGTAREFAEALRIAAVLPPCSLAEIAETVRTRCGDRILERQRQVATAVSSRRGIVELDAAETIPREGERVETSMEIRQQSVTLDLRVAAGARREGGTRPDSTLEAADTRDLRRDSAETISGSADDVRPRRREHSSLKTTILVAVVAAAVTAAVVVTVMMMNKEDPPQPVAPAPGPTINIVTPQAPTPPPADAAVVVETPIDAASPVEKSGKKPKVKKTGESPPKTGESTPKTGESKKEPTEVNTDDFVEEATKAADEAQKAGEELQKTMEKLRDNLKGKGK